ncbi:MAG: hypothetical protein ABII79_00645 [bacterium]
MQNTIQPITRFFLLVSVVCLCNCGGPRVEGLFREPEFTADAIRNRSIIIGGVTSALGNEEIDTLCNVWANLLREQLVEKLEGVNVVPLNYTKSTLREDQYGEMLVSFNNIGDLNSEVLEKLGGAFEEPRPYLVMCRLETDARDTSKGKNKDSTGAVINVYYLAHRKVCASFKVWDVAARKLVWSGRITGKATATNSYDQAPVTDDDGGSLLTDLLDVFLSDGEPEKYEYPETPSFTWVARTVFGDFAKALTHD